MKIPPIPAVNPRIKRAYQSSLVGTLNQRNPRPGTHQYAYQSHAWHHQVLGILGANINQNPGEIQITAALFPEINTSGWQIKSGEKVLEVLIDQAGGLPINLA